MIEPLTEIEFNKIRDLLVSVCGIDLKPDQDYLVETRLTELAMEVSAKSFGDLHRAIVSDSSLLPRVVDLMTTNETLWFRDDSCWVTMEEVIFAELIRRLEAGKAKVRVWSAASSTGQEAYSFSIMLDEYLTRAGKLDLLPRIEVIGTDISTAAIFLAKAGRYDPFTISRGMSDARLNRFFHKDGGTWVLNEEIRNRVKFQTFNLMDSFAPLGKFDIVLCRNVAIYFSDEFKTHLFGKISETLIPDGFMILGATESLFGIKNNFENLSHGNGLYYKVRKQ